MIKINILHLSTEGIDIEGSEESDFLEVQNSEFIKISDKIMYNLHASLVNNGVLVSGKAETTLTCKCGKCLGEYKHKLINNEVCHFYEKPNKYEIDLTDDIREDILISFPINLKCCEDCKGLCPKCGQNLNEKQCSCDIESENNDFWKELNNLKL